MLTEILTRRLRLIPLSLEQLRCYILNPEVLERELGLAVSRDIVTDRLRRAVGMKIRKMEAADSSEHAWYTYWLIVIKEDNFGAGLAGFKGVPGDQGQVEVGYGIDLVCRNQGYMTEAVKALIEWAFQDTRCKAVIAPDTKKGNAASNSVLKKVGMRVYNETEESFDWRVDKAAF